jgi:preprotein translocase subunit Sec61beta
MIDLNAVFKPFEYKNVLRPSLTMSNSSSKLRCVTLINIPWKCMRGIAMSARRRKKSETGRMPAQSAGLLRFFEEETRGIKIRPEVAVIMAVALVVASVLAQVFF